MIQNISNLLNYILTNPPTLIALLALIVSVVSIIVGFWGICIQRNHAFRSVRPIGAIGQIQTMNSLEIFLSNNGTGPMIIKSVETINDKEVKKNYPRDWIPEDYKLESLTHIEDCAILPGNPVRLLNFVYKNNPADLEKRDKIRDILKDLTIRIKYTDVYNREQPELKQSLDYFRQKVWD